MSYLLQALVHATLRGGWAQAAAVPASAVLARLPWHCQRGSTAGVEHGLTQGVSQQLPAP